jgi:hypothetical protein
MNVLLGLKQDSKKAIEKRNEEDSRFLNEEKNRLRENKPLVQGSEGL